MLAILLLQSVTTTCMVNGQYVTCATPGARVVESRPLDLSALTKAPEGFADAVAEGRCHKMAERASKAGDHEAAAKILASCKRR